MIGERLVAVERDMTHLEKMVAEHAAEAKENAATAKDDRRAIHGEIKALVEEIRKDRAEAIAKDIATNKRIDAYENQVKGGKTLLAFIATAWGVITGSMGAAVMWWIKSGSPPLPPR